MSVVSITAAARACQARAGANGRATTDMTRRPALGTRRTGTGLPNAASNRPTMPIKVTSSGPATSITRPALSALVAASTTTDATSSAETKLIGFSPPPRTSLAPGGDVLADDPDPALHRRGRPEDRPWHPARAQRLLAPELLALELVRVIGARMEDRDEHEPLPAGCGGRRDECSCAETIHGPRVRSSDAAEPADRADHRPCSGDRSLERLRIGDVAHVPFDAVGQRSVVTTYERTDRLAALREPGEQTFPERARPARHEDHRRSPPSSSCQGDELARCGQGASLRCQNSVLSSDPDHGCPSPPDSDLGSPPGSSRAIDR